jgi:hypothetical protein
MPLGRVPWIAWPTNSINARAAGDALWARRQTSVTGRRTATWCSPSAPFEPTTLFGTGAG